MFIILLCILKASCMMHLFTGEEVKSNGGQEGHTECESPSFTTTGKGLVDNLVKCL